MNVLCHNNITNDKSKQLKLSEKPDISQEIEYIENKKEQSNPKGSDCSQLAEKEGFEPSRRFPDLLP